MNTSTLAPETASYDTDELEALLDESVDESLVEPGDEPLEPKTDVPPAQQDDTPAVDAPEPITDHKINGLLNELRHTREELKALRSQQQAQATVSPVRDFASEKAHLQKQWEDGELDSDAYQNQRETLILEQAQHLAAAQFQQLQQQQQQHAQAHAWQQVIGPWEEKHADFLANPIRRNAVNDLINALDSDPNRRLSDQELLAKVEAAAFEAFNWQPKTTPPQTTPRALATARALAAASATPPPPIRGAGSALTAASVNLETLRPGEFSKLPPHVRKELLGEEV